MSEPTQDPAAPGKRSWGCLWLVALVIGLPAACTGILALSGSEGDWQPTPTEARVVCEDWVRDGLRAPSTAEFTDGQALGSGGDYTITGAVDAENGFGAMTRTDWTCEIEYRDTDQQWHGSAALVD